MITCARCGEQNADSARFCSGCGTGLAVSVPASEVRKTVTVMFVDVVGSTGLGERVDPESMRRVMTRYFEEIRGVVERHGGVVEKFIGDAVMAVFGVPTVHEDDALRALRAALEMRRRMVELGAELELERGIAVAWRTGINTGEVVAGDAGTGQRFVTGDAVNVAARLEQAARPAEILIGAATRWLVRDAATVERVAPVTAKGKSEPVEAYRLLDVMVDAATQPRRLEGPMIGRQRPRRLLDQAYEQVVEERVCHLVTLLGSAGVGKSRLMREFLDGLGEAALVLRGRCLSYGEGITYWPIGEVVRQAADLVEGDDDETLRRKIGDLLEDERDRVQVAERLGELLGRFEGGSVQEETFWAFRMLLESLAHRRPVVLVLDDLHWAEPTLLDLIEHICDWTRAAPILLACLARQELLDVRPGWGGGKQYATTVTLEPLSEAESHELVGSLLGDVSLGGPLAEKIASAAEGNPLFVEEMVGMLIDSGQLMRQAGGWTAASDLTRVAVPPTIHALLSARLDGLPAPERQVLERGAVEGKVFHRGAIAELAPDALRESVPIHLRTLARKELLRPERADFVGDEAFRFRHLLIRDAAYGALPKETRAELHARFADWLTRVAGEHRAEYEEILGYHLEQAFRYRSELGPPNDETLRLGAAAAGHLATSGRRALDRGDVHAATKLLTGALELMPHDHPDRSDTIADLGSSWIVAGQLQGADDLLAEAMEEASSAGDVLGAARAEVVRLAALESLGQLTIEDGIQTSERLLAVFEEHGDERGAVRAALELGKQHFFAGRARTAEDILAARVARYPAGTAPGELVGWLMAALYWGPTPVPQALSRIGELRDASQSRAAQARQLRMVGSLRAAAGDIDEGRIMIRRAAEAEEGLGRRHASDSTEGHFLGPLELLAGNYDEAERVLLRAYSAMRETGDTTFSATTAGYLADLYIDLSRFDEAERFAHVTLGSTPDDVEAQAQGYSALGRVMAARGDLAAAEKMARAAVEIAERTDYLHRRGMSLVHLADVLLIAGRPIEAADALRRALENFETKGATVRADRTRQQLAHLDAAPDGAH